MKFKTLILAFIFVLAAGNAQAQLLKKLKKRVERSVERKLEEKTAKETDKAMDTILDGNKKKKPENDETVIKEDEKETNTDNGNETSGNQNGLDLNEGETSKDLKLWSKYNFVPGDKIIFQDDLVGEENGEFPSRWDLVKGNVENASFANEPIINFDNGSIITPLMETDEYLPEVFTMEFDAYYDQEVVSVYSYHQLYRLRFWDGDSYITLPDKAGSYQPIYVYRYGVLFNGTIKGQRKEYKSFETTMMDEQPVWRHIAIAFNQRSLKIFVDEYRAINIPNLGFMPKKVSIEGYTHPYGKENFTIAIKNIRIAEGGKALYDRVMADGKFVTRGILFDVNKATIKPESMGVINEVARMMQEHPDLNFNIEGHTDSDGNDDYNQRLSEQRAAAVKEALINSGISEARMQTTGKGESVPITENNTPEGKANNRRVEFIKL
ncbi:OmpA family protein [Mariniflexile sp.]|uniref:OmpA family protein n=1 Tax=Mariniflexile sp. TaxID=1979402 RepID=UPI0040480421